MRENDSYAIIVLGSPNCKSGELSKIAKSRCDKAFQLYTQNPSCKVLCTGGFGEHFNTSPFAHGELTKDYLIKQGISRNAFLDVALSRFTFEDATMSLPILTANNIKKATVVSSEFHIKRVEYVFSNLISHIELNYLAATTPLDPAELELLYQHEEKAMIREKQNIAGTKV
ncbi:YdcF family protein [Pseudoalteromonas sp. KS88]|uniref:YdcF family protein n=1 Tax=Pseudoalteromonas sp. KS88 TaxID=2109918 RepID=UPI0010811593|nr:YdcF family protein [Pseudoalteromonas sp. KS88]TGE85771.1 YdcF family protein [Pseudoalteromonas sp. KS88]